MITILAAKKHRLGFALPIVAALVIVGCAGVVPVGTIAPSGSIPGVSPGATLPTFSPIATPSGLPTLPTLPAVSGVPTLPPTMPPTMPPTNSPTDMPTTTPTDTPTDAPTPPTGHPNWPAGALSTGEAAGHVGQNGTVCGMVNSTNWVFAETGHPTWLNMDSSYPNVIFNAVIWGEQRRAWPLASKPEVRYLNKEICVSGLIESYNGVTEIQDLTIDSIVVVN